MNKKIFLGGLLLFLALAFPFFASGKINVSIAAVKFDLKEPLKPGGVYEISTPISVFNNGDEPAEYTVSIVYVQNQKELRPKPEWFTFTPSVLPLEPGKGGVISFKISLPLKVEPGEYFALLSVKPRPVEKEQKEGENKEGASASINVAAAARLRFKVLPANVWQAIYYRTLSYFHRFSPWSYIVLGLFLASLIFVLLSRFFSLRISFQRKQ